MEERKARLEAAEAAKRDVAAKMSINDLFDRWRRSDLVSHKDKGAYVTDVFHRHVLPVIGSLHIETVTKGHVASIVDKVKARGGNGRMALATFALMRQMFGFGVERDFLQFDPTASIKRARIHKPTERDRALSQTEIRQLAQLLPHAGLARQSELCILAVLATACRAGELAKTKLLDVDIDAGTWRIPSETAKNQSEHIVQLSGFASGIFTELKARAEALGSGWLLPAANKPGPVCPKSLTKQISDRQRGDKPPMHGRSPLTSSLQLPGGYWRTHDLRRTAASLMAELGLQPHVIERCLNHTEQNRMVRVYQRHSYAPEMAQAWQTLGERLALLTSGQSANVTILRQASTQEQ